MHALVASTTRTSENNTKETISSTTTNNNKQNNNSKDNKPDDDSDGGADADYERANDTNDNDFGDVGNDDAKNDGTSTISVIRKTYLFGVFHEEQTDCK